MTTSSNNDHVAATTSEPRPCVPAPSTITRSMSRRSLTSTTLASLRASTYLDATGPSPARALTAAERTNTNSSGIGLHRSTAGCPGLAKPAGIGKPNSTPAARRRVLAESRSNGARISTMLPSATTKRMSTMLPSATTNSVSKSASAPKGKSASSKTIAHRRSVYGHGRRMSTAEAAQMTGMGIVRVGPAVTSPPRIDSRVAPSGTEQKARDLGLTFAASSTGLQRSMTMPRSSIENIPPSVATSRSPMRAAMALDESLPIAPSSPFTHALSPRALVYGPIGVSASGKKHSKDKDDSSDDEEAESNTAPYLSPQRKRMRSSGPSEALSSNLIRSPPKKVSSLPVLQSGAMRRTESVMAASTPPSVAMSRSPAMYLQHSSFAGATFGIPTSLPPPPSLDEVIAMQQQPQQPTAPFSTDTAAKRSLTVEQTEERLARRQSIGSRTSNIPRPTWSTSPAILKAPRDPKTTGDQRDQPTDVADVSMDADTTIGNLSMSEETVGRLANLQDLLSRLQMRHTSTAGLESASRPDVAPSRLPSSMSRVSLSNLANDAGPDTGAIGATRRRASASSMSALSTISEPPRRARTSLPTHTSSGPALPNERRRHSLSTRPTNGSSSGGSKIIRTGHSTGPLSSTMAGNNPGPIGYPLSRSSSVLPSSSSTASIAALASGIYDLTGTDGPADARSNALRGVVAFVDVRTAEGEDSGMVFVDMLRAMGARVITSRPTFTLTHIIFKAGRPGTLQRYRAHPNPKPHLVGIAWVVRCHELQRHADESPFAIDLDNHAGASVIGGTTRRRKSMEPRALAPLSVNTSHLGSTQASNAVPVGSKEAKPELHATIAASIERARRKSMQFAPKVGSPLARRVLVLPLTTGRDDEDDDE